MVLSKERGMVVVHGEQVSLQSLCREPVSPKIPDLIFMSSYVQHEKISFDLSQYRRNKKSLSNVNSVILSLHCI